jgi:V/A-type H+-transporting ATPase subunit I
LELREKAFIARMLLKAQQKFGKIDHTYFLTGWLPVHLYDTLKDRLMAATKGKAIIDRVDPEEVREVREGIVKIPILFNNPMLIRPFERLTMLYGTPSYQEVEPTVFLAVSFILLFGMMFGDVGHGLVLFLAGLYIFRRIYRFMDYGIILMECGVSSAIFGVLYGSIFGIEDLIPALWLHPMRDIESFMKVSGLIGVGMISLGLILNLVNIFKQKSWHELAGSSGLAGALLYWLLAGLGIRYMVAGEPLSWEIAAAKTAGALLLGIIILHRPVLAWLKKKKAEKEGEQQPLPTGPGMGALLLESTIEALDGVLRFLANTVSFVRVAAFALTHAALFIGVFSIADMVARGSGKGLSYYLTIVLGNIVIIVLEAMVVSIQTIRLEYYEFFSKFFRGGGQPFKPVVEEMKEAAK